MTDDDQLRSWLFRSLMFEADTDAFRKAGVRIGVDDREAEEQLLSESLDPFDLGTRNDARRMSRLYATLYCFENSVRDLIRSRLSEQDEHWWDDTARIPAQVKSTADDRKKKAENNSWLEGATDDIFGFVDFSGLTRIIIQNWSDFDDLIPSQHWLRQRFDELEQARNFVAHNRMLTVAEFDRLEMYVGDWNRQVGL